MFSSYYYHKLINLPTRERNRTSSLLDNIYTNIPDCYNTCTSGVLKFLTQSDHYPIFTIRNKIEQPKPKIHIKRRNHSNKNIALFRKQIKRNDWESLYRNTKIEPAFSIFTKTIVSTFQKCFPIEIIKLNHKNRNPWINQTLKDEIKKRDKFLMLSRKYPTLENQEKYKQFKNQNLSNQRKAERKYYTEQFELNKQDLKKSWKIIKNMIGKEDNRCYMNQIDFLINGQYISNNNTIANSFNNYFINVGNSLASSIQSENDPLLYLQTNIKSIYIPELDKIEIKSTISSMNNSSSGYDELPASIMKQCIDSYIEPLTLLINKSIQQGVFPVELKIARIIPLYKGENNQLIHNYRPISVLPFFSKIFEKIVYKYVVDFLDDNNIFYQYQFGFRKHHSTNHAIITLVERVTKALDTGKYIVGVFLDLKKAFDTVDHSILLKKLEKYGIRGNMHKWFKSYLSFRVQFVEYNNCHSDNKQITHGVPQGSILGPLLFILYINDFSKASDLLFSILFADDTSVFIEGTAYSSIIKDINTELEKVDKWLKSNKLSVNI